LQHTTCSAVNRVALVSSSQKVESSEGLAWAVAVTAGVLTLAATQKTQCEEQQEEGIEQIDQETVPDDKGPQSPLEQQPEQEQDQQSDQPDEEQPAESSPENTEPKERNGLGVYDWYKDNVKSKDEQPVEEGDDGKVEEEVDSTSKPQYFGRARAGSGENPIRGYQDDLRDYAENLKAFTFFATAKVDGEVYMRPQDFLRYLTRGEMQPSAYDDFDKFQRLDPATLPGTKTPSTDPLFQYEMDGTLKETDILISFPEFNFLKMLVTTSAERYGVAFRLVDLDGNGEICKKEFDAISGGLLGANDIRKSHVVRHLFGDDGQNEINAEIFEAFVSSVTNRILIANFLNLIASPREAQAFRNVDTVDDSDGNSNKSFTECASKFALFRMFPGQEVQGLGFLELYDCYQKTSRNSATPPDNDDNNDEGHASNNNDDEASNDNNDNDNVDDNDNDSNSNSVDDVNTGSESGGGGGRLVSSSQQTYLSVGLGSTVGALAGTESTFVLGTLVGIGVDQLLQYTNANANTNTNTNANTNNSIVTGDVYTARMEGIATDTLPKMDRIQLCKSLMRMARIPSSDRAEYYARVSQEFETQDEEMDKDVSIAEYTTVMNFCKRGDEIHAAMTLLYSMQQKSDHDTECSDDLVRISAAIADGHCQLSHETAKFLCAMLGLEGDDKLEPLISFLGRCNTTDKLQDQVGLVDTVKHKVNTIKIALGLDID